MGIYPDRSDAKRWVGEMMMKEATECEKVQLDSPHMSSLAHTHRTDSSPNRVRQCHVPGLSIPHLNEFAVCFPFFLIQIIQDW